MRKILWYALLALLMVVRNPHGAAVTARGLGGWLTSAADGAGAFVSSLTGGGGH